MGYCIKCGAKVEDGIRYCPQCGEEIPVQEQQRYTYGQETYRQDTYRQDTYRHDGAGTDAGYGDSAGGVYFNMTDVQSNKLMGVLSYLGILVLIPLLAGNKHSEYVKFHANQGLVLFILSCIVNLLSGNWVFGLHSLINFGGWWFGWIFNIVEVVLFVFAIIGIVYACRGDRRELPFIGQIHVLRW